MINGDTQKLKSKKQRRSFRKKWAVVGAVIVILFAGGVASAWLYSAYHQSTSPAKDDKAVAEKINQTIDDAHKLVNNGKADEALAAYDKAIDNTSDTDGKTYLYLNKATVSFNNKDYDEAMKTAKEAELLGDDPGVISLIGQIYEKKGDEQNAIEYYEKMITLIKKDPSPVAGDEIAYYEGIIDRLKGE